MHSTVASRIFVLTSSIPVYFWFTGVPILVHACRDLLSMEVTHNMPLLPHPHAQWACAHFTLAIYSGPDTFSHMRNLIIPIAYVQEILMIEKSCTSLPFARDITLVFTKAPQSVTMHTIILDSLAS